LVAEAEIKDEVAVSGYIYEQDGKKRKMTNAHLHNVIKDLKND
jgi:hypothetical protein